MLKESIAIHIESKPIAALFVEIVQKAAVAGPNAKNLARLWEHAEAVAKHYGIAMPPSE